MITIQLELSTVSLCAFLGAAVAVPPAVLAIVLSTHHDESYKSTTAAAGGLSISSAVLLLVFGCAPQRWWIMVFSAVTSLGAFISGCSWFGFNWLSEETPSSKQRQRTKMQVCFLILLMISSIAMAALVTFVSTQNYLMKVVEIEPLEDKDLSHSLETTATAKTAQAHSQVPQTNNTHKAKLSDHSIPSVDPEPIPEKPSQSTLAPSFKAHHRSDSKIRIPINFHLPRVDPPSPLKRSHKYTYSVPCLNNPSSLSLAFDSWDVPDNMYAIDNFSTSSRSSTSDTVNHGINDAGFVKSRAVSENLPPRLESHEPAYSQYDREKLGRMEYEIGHF